MVVSGLEVREVLQDLGLSAITHGQREVRASGRGAAVCVRQERGGAWEVSLGHGRGRWSATFHATGQHQLRENLEAALGLTPLTTGRSA